VESLQIPLQVSTKQSSKSSKLVYGVNCCVLATILTTKPTIGWNLVLAGIPILLLGSVLFGVGTRRANLLPGWRGAAPLLVALLPILGILLTLSVRLLVQEPETRHLIGEWGMVATLMMFGAAWVALGYALWSEQEGWLLGETVDPHSL